MNIEKVFIVPYSHLDWGWGYYLGPSIRDINRANSRIIRDALGMLEKFPEYKWCGIDKVYCLATFWIEHPEMRDKVRHFIMENRLDIAGGMVSTPHLLGISSTHCSGESFIRNIVYGRSILEDLIGFKFKNIVLQINDVTGIFSQLPQIAVKCGYRYLKFERPFEVYNKINLPLDFLCESPDGSRILCNRVPYGTSWRPDTCGDFEECRKKFLRYLEELSKFSRINFLLVYQGGDWDPPHEELVKFVDEWNRRGLKPRLEISTPTEYFETISKKGFPVIKGSLDNVSWAALYGIAGDKLRRLQKEACDLLLTCERFLTVASLMGCSYPFRLLKGLWLREVLWEDHNTLAYLYPSDLEVALRDIRYIKEEALKLLENALNVIAGNIGIKSDDRYIPVVVFNQLEWDRSDIVSARIKFRLFNGYKYFRLIDKNGKEVPYQILNIEYDLDGSIREVSVIFKADVPAFGYNTYYAVLADTKPSFNTHTRCFESEESGRTTYIIENDFFRIRIVNGHLTSIFDKRLARELLKSESNLFMGNSILCEKVVNGSQGLTGEVEKILNSSNMFSPDRIEIVEDGPVRAVLRVSFTYLENPLAMEIILYEGIPRIEFRTIIEARKTGRRFRVVFPLNVENGVLSVDKPFNVERIKPEKEIYEGGERSWGKMGRVFGAYSWADLSSNGFGAALISRQNAGFILENNMLSSILLLTVTPDPLGRFRKCSEFIGLGIHKFEYAIYPHEGDVYSGKVYKAALEYLNPLIPLVGVEGCGNLPPSYSFLRIRPENLILSALFRNGEEIVFRIFNIEGKETRASLEFFRKLDEIYESNFLGEPLRESDPLVFKNHEIKEIHGKLATEIQLH